MNGSGRNVERITADSKRDLSTVQISPRKKMTVKTFQFSENFESISMYIDPEYPMEVERERNDFE